MESKQKKMLHEIIRQSGQQVEDEKLNEIFRDLDKGASNPSVEEFEVIIKKHVPGLDHADLSIDNSDLDSILGKLGSRRA